MAARNHHVALPHQLHRGAGVPVEKQKNAAAPAPEGKNRGALRDIGNLANARVSVEGKQQAQITRPVTRSFGAQLVAKAQAQAAANNKPAPAPKQKPAPVPAADPKPEQQAVIVISPDTDEKQSKHHHHHAKAAAAAAPSSSSARKKGHSLTSVLAARSKAACRDTFEPKQSPATHDIDSPDAGDQLAVVDYVEDIHQFYKLAEGGSTIPDYMGSQPEINMKMRAILADWLIEVHHKFELMPETLYLTFYVLDRYLSSSAAASPVQRRELQLVGVAAMLVACKYEEIWAPEVSDFISISDGAYTRAQVLAMEKTILDRLQWSLTVPTVYVFLLRFIKVSGAGDVGAGGEVVENMVYFLSELAMTSYPVILHRPSTVAASVVYVARCSAAAAERSSAPEKKMELWTEALREHTGLAEEELWECGMVMAELHAAAPESKLKVVYRKYLKADRGGVASLPPAVKMIEDRRAAAAAAAEE